MTKRITVHFVILLLSISCSKDNEPVVPAPSGPGVFTSMTDDAVIEGELFLPAGDGPFPTLIIVPGSGNSPKEEAASFAPIINSFGYALYTYNKRGIGNSTGAYPLETINDPTPFLQARADDVKSIVAFLEKHADVKDDEIGLFGSSQGTWVNCLVYHDLPTSLSQIVMTSGGASSTGEEHYYEELIEEQGLSIEEANIQMNNFAGNRGFDPLPILENASVPMLFIYGGLDDSHPTKYDSTLVASLDKTEFEIHYYPNANHELIEENSASLPEELFIKLEMWLKSTAP